MLNRLSFVVLFLFFCCNEDTIDPVLFGTIQGKVTFATDGAAAAGVEITTNPGTSVVYTAEDGTFLLEVPVGTYALAAKLEGFKTESRSITVNRDASTNVDFVISNDNVLPDSPADPTPSHNALDIATEVTLKWSAPAADRETLTFDLTLYEGTDSNPIKKIESFRDTFLVVQDLKYNTNYFWQVVAKSAGTESTNGPLWHFKTKALPDNRFLFVRAVDANTEIFSSNESGTTSVRITKAPQEQLHPQFSNNGQTIFFTAKAPTGDHIYRIQADGTGLVQLTTLPAIGYHSTGRNFCLSPDNGKIMYSHYDKLYTIDTNGSNLTLVSTAPAGRHFRECDWTSVGNRVVVETVGSLPYESEIRLIELDNPQDSIVVGDLPGIVKNPSFSLDGNSILYTVDAAGFQSADGRQLDSRVMLLNLTTRAELNLSREKTPGTNDLNPRFTSNGASVLVENVSNAGGTSNVTAITVSDQKRKLLFENAAMPDSF
ncbi:MAG TPA: carboxypeptidase regulatory-like domain-containing protein [Chryseosolibacter sp.]